MAKAKKLPRVTWQQDVTHDPMYPFNNPPGTNSQPDTTATPPSAKKISWGSLKSRYRRKAEDDE